jgi:hemoglobin-like flavoprotein
MWSKEETLMSLQVELLEESFDLIAPRAEELVATFYERLFILDPALRPLFANTDMAKQRSMLLATLVLLRRSLRNLAGLVPALVSMGARHQGYGVQAEHYATVGQALLESMAGIGGDQWRGEYTAAWAAAYGVVRDTMLSGTAQETGVA